MTRAFDLALHRAKNMSRPRPPKITVTTQETTEIDFNQNSMPMTGRGGLSSIQKKMDIGGQPHHLSYINSDEANLLKQLGGSGRPVNGVPAYDYDDSSGGWDAGDDTGSGWSDPGDGEDSSDSQDIDEAASTSDPDPGHFGMGLGDPEGWTDVAANIAAQQAAQQAILSEEGSIDEDYAGRSPYSKDFYLDPTKKGLTDLSKELENELWQQFYRQEPLDRVKGHIKDSHLGSLLGVLGGGLFSVLTGGMPGIGLAVSGPFKAAGDALARSAQTGYYGPVDWQGPQGKSWTPPEFETDPNILPKKKTTILKDKDKDDDDEEEEEDIKKLKGMERYLRVMRDKRPSGYSDAELDILRSVYPDDHPIWETINKEQTPIWPDPDPPDPEPDPDPDPPKPPECPPGMSGSLPWCPPDPDPDPPRLIPGPPWIDPPEFMPFDPDEPKLFYTMTDEEEEVV